MSKPTTESTAAAESWLRSQQDLQSMVDEALELEEIAEALATAHIPVAEARAAILEDPTVLARLRDARKWSNVLRASLAQVEDWGLRSRRLRRASLSTRVVMAVLAISAYLTLLMMSAAVMPWWGNLVGIAGFFATLGFAAGLCGQELWALFRTVTSRPDIASWPWYVRDEVLLPELRQFIDERRAPDHGTTLALADVHNLYQDEDDAPVIITSAGRRLRRVMARSTSDAVAIAGHRGVGKTTVIQAVARGLFSDTSTPLPMSVVASAPSRYEARDFVLHLHAALAKRVLTLTGGRAASETRHRLTLLSWVMLGMSGILIAAAPVAHMVFGGTLAEFLTDVRKGASVVFAEFPRHVFDESAYDSHFLRGMPVAMLLLALVIASLAVLLQVVRLPMLLGKALDELTGEQASELDALSELARQQLDRIRFLQTYTSGWSGKVGIPIGSSDVGWSRGSQRAEQQLTHPEVVEAFREFAGQAAKILVAQGRIERIVIAVDELDKIAEPEKAHEFVNDIKGIFGVDGCLFLVAVSEDAISAFERRGIPVRDAFDSAFSEMVRMDPFTLAESRRWLSRRLVGVPEPFSCLCHCLSGGLPRDLRRSTVDMIDAVRETGARDLSSVTAAMIERELDRKAHAFAAAARRLDDHPEVTAHLADLLLIREAREPADLVELAGRLAPDETSTIPSIRWQSACFVLFCATVREVFTTEMSTVDERVGLLGTARAQLAVDPRVAWRVVSDVRTRYGLDA